MVKSYSLFRSIDTSLVDALCLVESSNYSFSFIYEAFTDAFDASTSSTAVFCASVYLRNTTRGANMGSMHHTPHHQPQSVHHVGGTQQATPTGSKLENYRDQHLRLNMSESQWSFSVI